MSQQGLNCTLHSHQWSKKQIIKLLETKHSQNYQRHSWMIWRKNREWPVNFWIIKRILCKNLTKLPKKTDLKKIGVTFQITHHFVGDFWHNDKLWNKWGCSRRILSNSILFKLQNIMFIIKQNLKINKWFSLKTIFKMF